MSAFHWSGNHRSLAGLCLLTAALMAAPTGTGQPGHGHDGIPALNMRSLAAVVVSQEAILHSPVLEPADIVVDLGTGAFFVVLEQGTPVDADLYAEFLQAWLPAVRVQDDPYVWILVEGEAAPEEVLAAILALDSIVDWATGRAIGFENNW